MNMHTKITTATATLAQLKPGAEYPGGNINARLTYTDQEIEELAASLKGPDGQLRPLLVATHPKKAGQFFVFAGGRRQIAFDRLIARGDLPKDHPIEIVSHGEITPDQALSKSLADNQAVPMHPADQAVTFAKLAADRTPEEIAKERGMTLKAVKQSIALGSALAPEVITAWRAGKLTRELVEAFTIASDFESQVKALNNGLANGYLLRANEIRRALMRNKEPEMKRLIGFVGVDAVRAAGIVVTEDFFGGGGNVQDMKGLHKLAKQKMESIAADLQASGWAWVETQMAPNHMHHGHGELSAVPEYTVAEKARLADLKVQIKVIEDADIGDYDKQEKLEEERDAIEQIAQFRAFTEKQKKKSGVIASLTSDGAVTLKGGLIRKEEPRARSIPGAPAVKQVSKPVTPDISREVDGLLDTWRDAAVKELIVAKPKEAFALYLASVCSGWTGPVEWSDIDNLNGEISSSGKFAANFDAFRKLSVEKLAAKLAVLVGGVTSIHAYHGGGGDQASANIVIGVIGEKNYQALLAKKFDAKAYVAGASKQHMLGILVETQGEASRRECERDADATLRPPVVAAIKATSWLPPQLRTKVYAGPSAKHPAKKKGK